MPRVFTLLAAGVGFFNAAIAGSWPKIPKGVTLDLTKPTNIQNCGNTFRANEINIPPHEGHPGCMTEAGELFDPCTGEKFGQVKLLNQHSIFEATSTYQRQQGQRKIKFAAGDFTHPEAYACDYSVSLNKPITLSVNKAVKKDDLIIRRNGDVVNIRNNETVRTLKPEDFTVKPKDITNESVAAVKAELRR